MNCIAIWKHKKKDRTENVVRRNPIMTIKFESKTISMVFYWEHFLDYLWRLNLSSKFRFDCSFSSVHIYINSRYIWINTNNYHQHSTIMSNYWNGLFHFVFALFSTFYYVNYVNLLLELQSKIPTILL